MPTGVLKTLSQETILQGTDYALVFESASCIIRVHNREFVLRAIKLAAPISKVAKVWYIHKTQRNHTQRDKRRQISIDKLTTQVR